MGVTQNNNEKANLRKNDQNNDIEFTDRNNKHTENRNETQKNTKIINPYRTSRYEDVKTKNRYFILNLIFQTIGVFTWMIPRFILAFIGQVLPLPIIWLLTIDLKFGRKEFSTLQEKPRIGKFRRYLIYNIIRVFYRIGFAGFGIFWIKENGKQHVDTKNAKIVVCAPHSTITDFVVFIKSWTPMTSVGLWSELKRPINGPTVRASETFFVDYNDKNSRSLAAETIKHRATSSFWEDVLMDQARDS